MLIRTVFLFVLSMVQLNAGEISDQAKETAAYAVEHYQDDMIISLETLVSFKTVASDSIPLEQNKAYLGFKKYLADISEKLGFDYHDYGYVVVIGLGDSKQRVGIITHGDVQPANAEKWAKSPYELDVSSEPGRLIGRGTEDDKGPIATALYAMKSLKDKKIPLRKRLELYVYMAEESDWDPLVKFLKTHEPPQINMTIDADYPVVVAEKGYGTISVTVPNQSYDAQHSYIKEFKGGFFASQIPEDAEALIVNADKALEQAIRQRSEKQRGMRYQFIRDDHSLTIKASGRSSHSSEPENGVNAISFLADSLKVKKWPNSTAGAMVNFLNDLVGTGYYGDKFGEIAYQDDFMGPMSLAATVLTQLDSGISLNINLRRPLGKSKSELDAQIVSALARWQENNIPLDPISTYIGEPNVQDSAPQIGTLLNVFSYYSGIEDAKAISIGGSTNSKLFPNAVSFGPSMPGVEYTGHSEHEFISKDQFLLNLRMYTAALVELMQVN